MGLFGIANFSNVFFTLRAEQVLQPSLGQTRASELAVLLYVILNVIYALGCYPAGYFADRISKRNLLALGYLVFTLACIASIFETPNYLILGTIFVLAGLQAAIVDTVEKTYASEILGDSPKGTGFGVLQTVNGIGDFTSSTMIGLLIVFLSPTLGFGVVAAIASAACVILLVTMKRSQH